jgi:arsenate reductase
VKHVLFVCHHNAGRSQMAEAFFNRAAPADVRAESAGATPRKEGVWPAVADAMAEVGFDIRTNKPKRLLVEMQLHADWAVTLNCGGTCPYVPSVVEDWVIPDPAGKTLAEVRVIRDAVEDRVLRLLDERLGEIRADRSAHERRLQALLPDLAAEFEGRHSPADIRACADAILLPFADAAVRTFAVELARQKARRCLQADICDPAAA